MKLVLVVLAIVGVYLWTAPADMSVAERLRSASRTVESVVASGSAPLTAQLRSGVDVVRTRALELLREQLHRSVDDVGR